VLQRALKPGVAKWRINRRFGGRIGAVRLDSEFDTPRVLCVGVARAPEARSLKRLRGLSPRS
jgi:hypothetical protein